MIKHIHICDKCKKETIVERAPDSGYRAIEIRVGDKGTAYVSTDLYSRNNITSQNLFLCPLCLCELGIKEPITAMTLEDKSNSADKILEMFAELVAEKLQDN